MNPGRVDASPRAMLEAMMLVRAFEEQNRALTAAGNLPGTCTSVGQEAAAVGVIRALAADDLILTITEAPGICSRAAPIRGGFSPRSWAGAPATAKAKADRSTSRPKSSG